MMWILLLVLVAIVGYLAWKSYDPATKSFNWKTGLGALAIAAAAVWAYVSDMAHGFFQ